MSKLIFWFQLVKNQVIFIFFGVKFTILPAEDYSVHLTIYQKSEFFILNSFELGKCQSEFFPPGRTVLLNVFSCAVPWYHTGV